MRTPWGLSDYEETLLPGVVIVCTPSHGGIHLSLEREAELDAALRAVGLTAKDARMGYSPGWYEEDCCALAPMWMWDEVRRSNISKDACLERLRYWINYEPGRTA